MPSTTHNQAHLVSHDDHTVCVGVGVAPHGELHPGVSRISDRRRCPPLKLECLLLPRLLLQTANSRRTHQHARRRRGSLCLSAPSFSLFCARAPIFSMGKGVIVELCGGSNEVEYFASWHMLHDLVDAAAPVGQHGDGLTRGIYHHIHLLAHCCAAYLHVNKD